MPGRKKKSKTSKKKQGKSGAHRGVELTLLLGLTLLMFYLWGRVQIDTVIRDRARLETRRMALVREIDGLRVEVNALKSYAQISAKAKAQGMDVIPASRRRKLAVDLHDVLPVGLPSARLRVAGLGVWLGQGGR